MRGLFQEAGDQALKGGEGPKPDPGLKMSGTRSRTGRVRPLSPGAPRARTGCLLDGKGG